MTPPRALVVGIWGSGGAYPRPRNLIAGLRAQGWEVTEAHHPIEGYQPRWKSASGARGPLRFALALLASYATLTVRVLAAPRADLILVPFPGVFHIPLLRFLRLFAHRRAVLALDLFFSLHEALVSDRRLWREESFPARSLLYLERSACRLSDLVLLDTGVHARWAEERFGIPPGKTVAVPVGPAFLAADTPSPAATGAGQAGPFTVLFVGTYIPLQGVEVIVEAARLLSPEERIRFTLVGKGQTRGEMERRAREGGARIEFTDWVPASELAARYRSCSLALGIFGTSEKAGRVIPSKVFDICAAGAPFVTADTPAIREAFTHGEDAYLVPAGDPRALAEAVRALANDPPLRRTLAVGAHRAGAGRLSPAATGRALTGALVARNPHPC